MEEESALELVQRYRRDRRVLLNFILSGSLIKKVVMPPGAVSLDDVNLDQVSIDYVLNCAKKGEMLDLSEAIRAYHDSLVLPPSNYTGFTEEFFLVTNPELSGSPPPRPPPPVPVSAPSPILTNISKSESFHSQQAHELTVDDIDDFEDEDDEEEIDSLRVSRRNPNDASDFVLGLPCFATGITNDDLREAAYEILLASAGAAGGLIVPSKEKKKEKRSRLMRKLARGKNEVVTQSQRAPGLVGLLETMRVQLEISEAMDIRTRQGLLNALIGREGKRMDTVLVPLELLCCISRTEFSDKKAYLRWQKRQLNLLEEGLLNHPAVGFGESRRRANDLRVLLRKIEDSELLPSSAGEVQRTECLRSLREICASLSERPVRGDLTGEVCHWADGYHLNVMLYEKLLLSVFDILDEGRLTEEVEAILELLKSTWRILGITETIHDTCYSWVLFRQFVITGEQKMLQHATSQLRKIPLKEQRGPQERLHLKSLRSSVGEEGSRDLTFMQSFLLPIQKWADKKLGDYHLNFSEGSTMMEEIVTVATVTRRLILEEPGQEVLSNTDTDRDQIEAYISSSIKHEFARILHAVEASADTALEHVLATLADECKKLLKKDSSMFMPILSQWNPRASVVSSSLIHKLYGNKLKPFLDSVEHLTEDVVSVLPAADSLEKYIMDIIISTCEDESTDVYRRERLTPYQVETVSGTLVMRWVNSQLVRVLGWVERAIQQERWDPISPQLRHASSIVEVYRIIEETVDQFFTLKVPMRPGELNSLFRGLDNAFQVYTQNIVDKLVSKEDLIPPTPILTRYKKEHGIKAFVKKELADPKFPEERKSSEINVLSTSTLCVRLNTLHYAISQLNKLEDSIWERWARRSPRENPNTKRSIDEKSRSFNSYNQKDAFIGSRKDINAAIDRICELTGIKIIFWDLREPFIDNLYKNGVSQSRLDTFVEGLDLVLNELCDVIIEPLRDRIVTGLLQASLDGLLRVLLDGGPSRVFYPTDAKLLEDDLEILKEFFISGGDGLPRGTVENLVARVRPVINLHSCETRVLIDDLKSASGLGTPGNTSKLGADTQTLLRILCHRSDSEANQFLKKQFKIPRSAA